MSEPNRVPPGRRLAAYRELEGMRQPQMAEKLGINQSHLSLIESGKRNPGRDLMMKISEVTGGKIGVMDWFDHRPTKRKGKA